MSDNQQKKDTKSQIKDLFKQTYEKIDSDIEDIYKKKKERFKRS